MRFYGTKKGFTLVEILVVIAVLGIVLVSTLGPFSNYVKRQQFSTEANSLSLILREQKTKAVSSLSDSAHGFNISSSTLTVFTGSDYVIGDINNLVTSFVYTRASATLSNYGVPTSTVYFDKRTGVPSATGTIELHPESTIASSTTITIYASGLIE